MSITLSKDAKPHCVTPLHWKDRADIALNNLHNADMFEPVPMMNRVTGSCPHFFWPKTRWCVGLRLVITDFNYINKFVKRPIHLLPSSSEIMQIIPASLKVFAKLDTFLGYHEIPLQKDNKNLTAFLHLLGHYRYTGGPMGLSLTEDEWCFQSDAIITNIPGLVQRTGPQNMPSSHSLQKCPGRSLLGSWFLRVVSLLILRTWKPNFTFPAPRT